MSVLSTVVAGLTIFANLEVKRPENILKKRKRFDYKCVIQFYCTPLQSLAFSIFAKHFNIFAPNVQCTFIRGALGMQDFTDFPHDKFGSFIRIYL